MKKSTFVICLVSVFFLSSMTGMKATKSIPFFEESVMGVFDGHEDYGYNFIVTNEDDEEHMMTFQNVSDEVLKAHDLNSETLIGKKFTVTYTIETDLVKDEDGYEDEVEILTITALEAI